MNSRAKEQGDAEASQPTTTTRTTVCSNAVRAAAAPKPPFRMEIVEAQGVREVLFDAETGRPIRPTERRRWPDAPAQRQPRQPVQRPTADCPRQPPPATAPAPAADKMLEEFPVEFNQPQIVYSSRSARGSSARRASRLAITTQPHGSQRRMTRPITKEVQGCTITTASRGSASCRFARAFSRPCSLAAGSTTAPWRKSFNPRP